MNETPPEVEVLPVQADPPASPMLPPGVQPSRNYMAAVQLGHVLSESGYYTDAREPAKAAVKVMVGMDLGLSPTASLQAIHTIESEGRVQFLIEGKLLAALVKMRDGYDYRFAKDDKGEVQRTDERVEIEFWRGDTRQEPNMVWTMEKARKAGLTAKKSKMYEKYPAEMLTWRALAEGVRIHFPELIAGQPIYAFEEFGEDVEEVRLRDALAPAKAQPLTDEKAEELRTKARAAFDALVEINPDRMPAGRFAQMITNAEHSHEQLGNVVASLEDLRDTEGEIAELKSALETEVDPDTFKEVVGRADRRGSNRERIEVLRNALEETTGANGGGDGDGE
jgi:hypothetical protein